MVNSETGTCITQLLEYTPQSIFLKPILNPQNAKQAATTVAQESRRKYVERLFGVLQGRFRILRIEFHEWHHSTITKFLKLVLYFTT